MNTYRTRKVFKDGSDSVIVDEGLTRDEAKELVQEDMELNEGAEEYMLVFEEE